MAIGKSYLICRHPERSEAELRDLRVCRSTAAAVATKLVPERFA